MIKIHDVSLNFWEEHPDLKSKDFNKLYKEDKSKGKKRSSLVMWCISMIFDDESKYYNVPMNGEDGKAAIVFDSFLNNASYYEENKELVDDLGTYYEYLCSTPAKRHLKSIENLLDDRTKFLSDNKYTLLPTIKEAVELDKLVISTDKLTETYENAIRRLSKENNSKTKGDVKKSAGDKEQI